MPLSYDPEVIAALKRHADRSGDPLAFVASAIVESNLRRDAVGDGGNSGGLFQENTYGRGAGIPMQQRFDPEGASSRAADEFRTFYDRGARGAELAYRAQRPANRGEYIRKVNAAMDKARTILGLPEEQLGASPTPPDLPGAPQQPESNDLGLGDILSSRSNDPNDTLASAARRAFVARKTQEAFSFDADVAEVVSNKAPAKPTTAAAVVPGGEEFEQLANPVLGTPYSWGGGTNAGPSEGFGRGAGIVGFDCSSLVKYLWDKKGVAIPRTTYEQIKQLPSVSNDQSQWRAGDLIFPHEGHVMMYLGNGRAVESPRTGGHVQIVPVRPAKYVRRPGGG